MIRIANPLYDVVFKYLMEDRESACLLLSRLLGMTILDIDFLAHERTVELERQSLTVYRLDFSARIQAEDGSQRQVVVEVQKAKFLTDILRFREYLGQEYSSRANVKTDKDGEYNILPIISVYILGYNLKQITSPVIKVNRQIKDLITGKVLDCTESFVECLTHDCYIVQTGRLKAPYRNDLELLLSIFDQATVTADRHVLEVDEDRYPEGYRRVLRRLNRAVTEEAVRMKMDAEDDFLEELEARERQVQDMAEALKQREKVVLEQQKALQETHQALQEKNLALQEKDLELEESRRIIEELRRKLEGGA